MNSGIRRLPDTVRSRRQGAEGGDLCGCEWLKRLRKTGGAKVAKVPELMPLISRLKPEMNVLSTSALAGGPSQLLCNSYMGAALPVRPLDQAKHAIPSPMFKGRRLPSTIHPRSTCATEIRSCARTPRARQMLRKCRAVLETEFKALKRRQAQGEKRPRRQLAALKILVLARNLHGTLQVAPCGLGPPAKC